MRVNVSPKSCKVYTPSSLAAALVRAVGDTPESRWLEPSHGKGAFLTALAEAGVAPSRIVAIDLDPVTARADRLAKVFRGINFISWSQNASETFDRIVGNPPYIAIGRLSGHERQIASQIAGPDGRPIGLGSNLWYAFVLASLRVLSPGGSLAFVLPSAAEYADYSANVRDGLRKNFSSVEVYRCKKPLFPDVQEGTVVAIARGFQNGPSRYRRRVFATASGLLQSLESGNIGEARECRPVHLCSSMKTIMLGEVARIRLGGVTGDARFFLINEAQRRSLDLPIESLNPVLSRARHLRNGLVDGGSWNKLLEAGERVWLFNPSEEMSHHPSVSRRLALLESSGGCNRSAYKVASRHPWYVTPLPKAPHGFISGMGGTPWIALSGKRNLNATNTLYVVSFAERMRVEQRWEVSLALLTTYAQRQLRRSVRRYADGLLKHEPGAISGVRLPFVRCQSGVRATYLRAVEELVKGNAADARSIADACICDKSASPEHWPKIA